MIEMFSIFTFIYRTIAPDGISVVDWIRFVPPVGGLRGDRIPGQYVKNVILMF